VTSKNTNDAPPRYVLTTACPDTTGIVAAVTGFLAVNNGLIIEAQHFDDMETRMSFIRIVFQDNGSGLPTLGRLEAAFAGEVAERFAIRYAFRDTARKTRVIVAVSKQGHCLNSLLHRWSTGSLPIQVVAVVSNHQDMRSLVEWHGVPFHYLPIIEGRKAAQEARIRERFESADGELLVLARYMQILSNESCTYFAEKAINIHHSFLPSFKGARPYHQAHSRGVKLIGATAHYVTADLDEGPIIEQSVERVDHSTTPEQLAAIGADVESLVLNRAVQWHAECRVFRNGVRAVVLR
jgi:formyltetrahydrofolate deformylase